jgi:tRNA splicing endonuclease
VSDKVYKIGDHDADVRMHEDRLVIKIETESREHSQAVYKDLVAKGVIVPVKLN